MIIVPTLEMRLEEGRTDTVEVVKANESWEGERLKEEIFCHKRGRECPESRWSALCFQLSYLYAFLVFLRPCSACRHKNECPSFFFLKKNSISSNI